MSTLAPSFAIDVGNGHVRHGDVVAITDAGPIGLSTVMGARLFGRRRITTQDLAGRRRDATTRVVVDEVINNGHEIVADDRFSRAAHTDTGASRVIITPSNPSMK